MTTKDIITNLLKYSDLTVAGLSKKIGLDRPQSIYDIQKEKTKGLSSAMIIRIISVYPEISKTWLMTGQGEMLINNSYNTGNISIKGNNNRDNNVGNNVAIYMTDSKEDVIRRIKQIRQNSGLLSKNFAAKARIDPKNYSSIENGKRTVGDRVLKDISDAFNINLQWLLTGQGEMLKPRRDEAVQINLEDVNIMLVPLVSKYAYAGFLSGHEDGVYLDSLPKVPFIADHNAKGVYYAFEVKGDSMDDDSRDSIIEGDILFCREIEPLYWQQKKLHIRRWSNFVIVHKTDGILIKNIIQHDVEKGIITIHSLNPFFEDEEINLIDIAGIYNVIKIERKQM